ncbi:MAG: ABC transporter substrate-binding protein [Streptosporangiaceae bacterium]|nr:ABC transporter substrate-binding protein [Streptosporangiaceae bacterium]
MATGLLTAACASTSTSTSGTSTSSATASAAAVTVPSSALGQAGTIRYCSDISSPPLEFYASGQTPTGSDVDLGNAIAHELGLTPQWVNTAFAGIIPALQAGHCDAILSQLFDKPARRAVVNFVDYMNSSEAVLVRAGNPKHVTGIAGLCGLNVAAETGTTVTDYLSQQSKTCTADGKRPIQVQTFLRDSDALNQLALGHVDAYGTTVETAGYDMSKNRGMFEIAGPAFGQIPTGIATVKSNTALQHALAAAFAALIKNGTYTQIMTKWNLGPDMLKQG